jgi:hypothetical protein
MEYADILKKATSMNYLTLEYFYELEQEEMSFLESVPGVKEIRTQAKQSWDSNQREYVMRMDGGEYGFGEEYVSFSVFYSSQSKLVSQNEYSEFEHYYSSAQVSYGRASVNENEAVLSYNFFKRLSLDVDDVLNKTVTLGYRLKDVQHNGIYKILADYKVVGIFREEFERVVMRNATGIYVKADAPERSAISSYLYLDSYRNRYEIGAKVARYFDEKGKLFVLPGLSRSAENENSLAVQNTALFGVTDEEEPPPIITVPGGEILIPDTVRIVYSPIYELRSFVAVENQRDLINEIMVSLGVILFIAAVVNTVMLLFFDIQRKGIYLGVLKAQGMTRSNVFFVIFAELMSLFVAATVVAAIVAYVAINLISGLTLDLVNVSLTLNMRDYIYVGLGVLGIGAVLMSLISIFLVYIHAKQDVVRLL